MAILAVKEIFEAPPGLVLDEAETRECELGGLTPEEAIRLSIDRSREAFAVYANEEIICLWGFAERSPLSNSASVWFLSTPAARKWPIHILGVSRKIISALLNEFCSLNVLVDERCEKTISWLEWMGFISSERARGFIELVRDRGKWAS